MFKFEIFKVILSFYAILISRMSEYKDKHLFALYSKLQNLESIKLNLTELKLFILNLFLFLFRK